MPAALNAFSFLFVLLFQFRHHRRIRQCSGVTHGSSIGNIPEQAPHDLAATRLRQLDGKKDLIRSRDGTDLLRNMTL